MIRPACVRPVALTKFFTAVVRFLFHATIVKPTDEGTATLKNQAMKNRSLFLPAIAAFALACVLGACSKNPSSTADVSPGKQDFTLYMTDAPALFDHVNIDIRSVKVLVDTSTDTRRHDNIDWDRRGRYETSDSSLVWQDLNITPGVYDILRFRNGADTILASAGIARGSIRLIKIQIGTNNSLVKDSVTYPVTIPSGADNYVLVKLSGNECEQYLPGRTRLWLDFDIARSVVADIRNQFYLRPVFHFFIVSTTGALAGRVTPHDALPVISVYNATDTAYALPDRNGNFKLRGLKAGTYTVFVNASNGYADATLTNISVKAGAEASTGEIRLSK